MSNLVYVEKKGLPSGMLDRLIRVAAFQNPEFYKAQAMRLSTYGKPPFISCGERGIPLLPMAIHLNDFGDSGTRKRH
jgi:hypothetical protein